MSDEAPKPPSGELGPPGHQEHVGRFQPGNTLGQKFQPGNAANLRHGLRSRLWEGALPEQAEAAEALREREAAILADLGGSGEVSTVAAGVVRRHCRLELVDDHLWRNLQRFGPLTGKGKTRAALTAWLRVQDRLHRSATTLGLQRRARRMSFAEQVLEAAARNTRPDGDESDD
jgi:hypothetical protein